jgi:DNA-binding GntR family transcriptional regulator
MSSIGPKTVNGSPEATDRVTEIHDALRESIIRGELEPGQIISQVKLAREFEVGRTPLREALRMLQREGLVEGEFNRRVRVAPFSVADFEQLYALRILIESHGVRVGVPRFSTEELDQLELDAAEMADSAHARDLPRWEQAHRKVHLGLMVHAGERSQEQTRTLIDHARRYRHLFIRNDPIGWGTSSDLTGDVVAACRARSASEASQQLALLLTKIALVGVSLIAPEHDPAIVRAALAMVVDEQAAPPAL